MIFTLVWGIKIIVIVQMACVTTVLTPARPWQSGIAFDTFEIVVICRHAICELRLARE